MLLEKVYPGLSRKWENGHVAQIVKHFDYCTTTVREMLLGQWSERTVYWLLGCTGIPEIFDGVT